MNPMNFGRALRNSFHPRWSLQRKLPATADAAIARAIAEGELRHEGELRVVVEACLPLGFALSSHPVRARAVDLFAQHRVWDTEHNAGVLLYVQLAERRLEIVADRGIHAKVGPATWEALCGQMASQFKGGQFASGIIEAIEQTNRLLYESFPRRTPHRNELPDAPVRLKL